MLPRLGLPVLHICIGSTPTIGKHVRSHGIHVRSHGIHVRSHDLHVTYSVILEPSGDVRIELLLDPTVLRFMVSNSAWDTAVTSSWVGK